MSAFEVSDRDVDVLLSAALHHHLVPSDALVETGYQLRLANLESLRALYGGSGDAEKKARGAADAARELAERRRRHAEATSRAAALAERADERAALAATIDRAHRASRVTPLLTAADRRAHAYTAATKAAADSLGTVATFLDLPPHLLADPPPTARRAA